MRSLAFVIFFTGVFAIVKGQQKEISFGIFTGLTSPYTFDSGINRDSRYEQPNQVKLLPLGISFGLDYQGYGFVITPSIINIGQDMNIVNITGGVEGKRGINLKYVQVPVSLKLHAIDVSSLKVSVVAGVAAAYLLDGNETVTHNSAKYRFPTEVFPILPPDYVVEYDGVLAPSLSKVEIVSRQDLKTFQLFASVGFRSDWDFKQAWRVSFDLRANYGFNETRDDAYRSQTKTNAKLYDLHGDRREMFVSLSVGIARFIEVKHTKSFSKSKSNPKKKRKN